MMGVPLDFAPGTDAKYSNVGFILLGEVIAKVAGDTYDRFVVEQVLRPMGIKGVRLQLRSGQYPAGAVHRHLAGSFVPLPAMKLPMVDAAGGWVGSVVDLARFLTNLDGTRGEPVLAEKTRALMTEPPPAPLKPRDDGTYFGLGWDSVFKNEKDFGYFKDGSYQGIRTYMKRLPNGVSWALLFNASMEFDSTDAGFASAAIRETRKLVEGLKDHPDVDLFKDFP
jgi:N-acyl-D-amino-acid deacylase